MGYVKFAFALILINFFLALWFGKVNDMFLMSRLRYSLRCSRFPGYLLDLRWLGCPFSQPNSSRPNLAFVSGLWCLMQKQQKRSEILWCLSSTRVAVTGNCGCSFSPAYLYQSTITLSLVFIRTWNHDQGEFLTSIEDTGMMPSTMYHPLHPPQIVVCLPLGRSICVS